MSSSSSDKDMPYPIYIPLPNVNPSASPSPFFEACPSYKKDIPRTSWTQDNISTFFNTFIEKAYYKCINNEKDILKFLSLEALSFFIVYTYDYTDKYISTIDFCDESTYPKGFPWTTSNISKLLDVIKNQLSFFCGESNPSDYIKYNIAENILSSKLGNNLDVINKNIDISCFFKQARYNFKCNYNLKLPSNSSNSSNIPWFFIIIFMVVIFIIIFIVVK